MKIKTDKSLLFNVVFIVALLIFVIIVFHLSVNAFIIVMPIFAALVLLSIFLFNSDDKNKS